jgi:mRNA-degrading endonuclease RelE of RelBE toxin-antitoxin system
VASGWTVEISRPAQAGLDQLFEDYGEHAYNDALDTLLSLEEDPTPPEAQHLRKTKADYRIYLYRSLCRGVYRVIFGKRLVIVLRVGPRGGGLYRGAYEKW